MSLAEPLGTPQLLVGAGPGDQVAVRAALGDPAVLQHNHLVGGDFFKVQGAGQQGLTRFNASGPGARPGTPAAPTVTSTVAGRVDIRFPTVLDLDDTTLTYRIKRFSVGQLLATRTATSTFWSKPTVSVSDPTLPSGTKVAYKIEVTDGNHTISGPFSPVVTVH